MSFQACPWSPVITSTLTGADRELSPKPGRQSSRGGRDRGGRSVRRVERDRAEDRNGHVQAIDQVAEGVHAVTVPERCFLGHRAVEFQNHGISCLADACLEDQGKRGAVFLVNREAGDVSFGLQTDAVDSPGLMVMPADPSSPPIMPWPSSRAHVDTVELHGQRVVRAFRDALKGGGGRPDLAKQLALGDPRQPLAGSLLPLGADVDAVVELEVDHRDDGRVGHALGNHTLGFLHGVPVFGIAVADEPADLNVVEGQLRLSEIGTDGRDEAGEDFGENFPGVAALASLSP